jgi:hypothetical protein
LGNAEASGQDHVAGEAKTKAKDLEDERDPDPDA